MKTSIRSFFLLVIAAMTILSVGGLFLTDASARSQKTQKPAAGLKTVARTPNAPNAPVPASGTLTPANPSITYTDGPLVTNPTHLALGEPDCTVPNSCSDFTLTINAASVAATKDVVIAAQWDIGSMDFDMFIKNSAGNVVATNLSTADPTAVLLPVPANGTVYHIIIVNSVGTGETFTGTITLRDKATPVNQGPGAPPRYMNYPAGTAQANNAGEPSIGIDWNPNVATLKHDKVNTGGVAFFTSGANEWRANFDDCSSPAVNLWENKSSTFTVQSVLSDPIGFVDHSSTVQLGLSYPPPLTPGRVFTIDLLGGQGDSVGGYSDNDGNSYLPGGNGGAPAGPDHETLGGGPFHAPIPTPPAPAYPNAIYYCSQNIAPEAECSRSDDGGQTFGPGVPIFNPQQCTGGIHGHVKVSPQGTVYVPNSACGTPNGGNPGTNGVAVSNDNGVTWNSFTVPGSNGSQDPSVGIGQNNVGKPPGQVPNTVYLGWVDIDNHAHIAHSGDEGATWQDNIDVSSILGVQSATFPVVVAGDDNRAAFGFLGTTVPGPGAYSDPSFPGIWHLYIAHTYDGGHTWLLIDATPNDAVQKGEICLLGLSCSSAQRGLLDFMDFSVDAQGRGVLGYADGCVNCNNTFTGQSQSAHGTIARQSGGRRLFAAFDPVEPGPPAAPQLLSSVRQSSPPGVLVSWLEPDNGGSPISGYNIYRSTTSGAETFLGSVIGNTTTKYLDQTALVGTNYFYRVTAINGISEGSFCREVNVNGAQPGEDRCNSPYLQIAGPGAFVDVPADPTQGQLTIQRVNMGEPFTSCTDNSLTFVMKVNTLSPGNTGQVVLPVNAEWQILFDVVGTDGNTHRIYVEMDTFPPFGTPTTPAVTYGRQDPCSSACGTLDTGECTQGVGLSCPAITLTTNPDGTITFKLKTDAPLTFTTPGAPGVGTAFTWDPRISSTHPEWRVLKNIVGNTQIFVGAVAGLLETVQQTTGTTNYTMAGNLSCVAAPPIATLSANPLSGTAPLMVAFNASASSDPSPCNPGIASYTLDFGDGTAPVTQASSMFTHTYNNPGDFPARLTVTSNSGQVSVNQAQVIISVSGTGPELTSVVSRKMHGNGTGIFDINIPLSGTRGVECRAPNDSSVGSVEYKLVFTFPNLLSSVGGVTVTSTGGSPGSGTGAIDPTDAHRYIVNLSGLPNTQYITVTLTNVHDAANHVGDVGATFGLLVGDVNASGRVDSGDVFLIRQQSLQDAGAANFRNDLNSSGRIDSGDVFIGRQNSLNALPTPP